MQPSTAALTLVLLAHSAIADNHTGNHTEESSGLDGGAVAGIVIGVLLGVGALGAAVYYRGTIMSWFSRDTKMEPMAVEATGGRASANNLPMMAMRVPGDEQL